MKEFIEQIMSTRNVSNALIEAGHIYAGNQPDGEVTMGLEIGRALYESLVEMGMKVDTMLFIDDYNGHGSGPETLQAMQPIFETTGFFPVHIVYENNLVNSARNLQYSLPKVKQRSKSVFAVVGSDIIDIERTDEFNETKVTCIALDAALYLEKAKQANGGLLVTVLPQQYKPQQEKTKALARAAGCNAPILNCYFDDQGKIKVDFDY